MSDRLVIDVHRDGWTKGLQLGIVQVDENGSGSGYRLHGPKFNGSSTPLLKHVVDERDAAEIRKFLDDVFPLPKQPSRAEVLREAADEMDTHCEKFGVLGVGDRLRRMANAADQGEKDTRKGESTPPVVSYYIQSRLPGSDDWERIGVRFSWTSREKADEKLAAIRERLPHATHRLITRTTVVTDAPTETGDAQ